MRRGDPWLGGVGTLITMVIWWNPFVWLLRAGMHRDREMAADAWAIRRGTEPPEELARGLFATQCWVTQRGSDGRHGVSIAAVPSRGPGTAATTSTWVPREVLRGLTTPCRSTM